MKATTIDVYTGHPKTNSNIQALIWHMSDNAKGTSVWAWWLDIHHFLRSKTLYYVGWEDIRKLVLCKQS